MPGVGALGWWFRTPAPRIEVPVTFARPLFAACAAVLALTACGGNDVAGDATPVAAGGSAQQNRAAQATTAPATTSAPSSPAPSSPAPSSAAPSSPASAAAAGEAWATDPLYLVDLPDEQFVTSGVAGRIGQPETGTAKVNATSYPQSVWWSTNVSSDDERMEFNLPAGYAEFIFTLGMTDDTVVTNRSDGRAQVLVYVGGELVFGPEEAAYPDTREVVVPLGGKTRARVDIVGLAGSYDEQLCLCSAKFTR